MKKFVSLTLALVMCLGCFTPALAADSPSSWAAAEVKEAVSLGLVPAQLQSNYTTPMTRAEYCLLVTTLLEVLFDRPIDGVVAFFDKGLGVSFNDTDAPYILAAANLEIVNGVGDGAFAPERTLIRAEAATMLSRTLELFLSHIGGTPTYADTADIPDYAVEPFVTMWYYKIMRGDTNNRITPLAPYTREAAILTSLRLYKYIAENPCLVLNRDSVNLAVGETWQIDFTVIPAGASDEPVTWENGDTSIAEVSDGGLVTAKSTGNAIITVIAGTDRQLFRVNVVGSNGASFTVDVDKIEFWSADAETMFGANRNICCDELFFEYSEVETLYSLMRFEKYIHLTSGTMCKNLFETMPIAEPMQINDDAFNPYTIEVVGPQDVVSVEKNGTVRCIAFLKPGDESKTTSVVVTSPWDGTSVTIPVTVHYFPIYDGRSAEYLDAYGRELLRLCNEARAEIGVAPMTYAADVQDVANLRSVEMFDKFSHTRPNGQKPYTAFTELGHSEYTVYMVGENIAYTLGILGTSPEMCAKEFFEMWMSSPGHKANILNPRYTHMVASVAYADDGSDIMTSSQLFIIK